MAIQQALADPVKCHSDQDRVRIYQGRETDEEGKSGSPAGLGQGFSEPDRAHLSQRILKLQAFLSLP